MYEALDSCNDNSHSSPIRHIGSCLLNLQVIESHKVMEMIVGDIHMLVGIICARTSVWDID